MKKSLSLSILACVFILSFGLFIINAQKDDCENIDFPKSVNDFLKNIENINQEIIDCELSIPGSINFLVGNGNILINIEMISGENESFYVSLQDKKISSLVYETPEKYKIEIKVKELVIQEVLDYQGNKIEKILEKYNSKEINIRAVGTWTKIKLFIGKFFI